MERRTQFTDILRLGEAGSPIWQALANALDAKAYKTLCITNKIIHDNIICARTKCPVRLPDSKVLDKRVAPFTAWRCSRVVVREAHCNIALFKLFNKQPQLTLWNIRYLEVSSFQYDTNITLSGVGAVVLLLPKLEELSLGGMIKKVGVGALGAALSQLSSLKKLQLSNASWLAPGTYLEHLEELTLYYGGKSHNLIKFANMLPALRRLRVDDLSDADRWAAVFIISQRCKSLEWLRVWPATWQFNNSNLTEVDYRMTLSDIDLMLPMCTTSLNNGYRVLLHEMVIDAESLKDDTKDTWDNVVDTMDIDTVILSGKMDKDLLVALLQKLQPQRLMQGQLEIRLRPLDFKAVQKAKRIGNTQLVEVVEELVGYII